MSTPARVARTAAVGELTPGAASVSVIVTPRKPSSPRRRSPPIRDENTEGRRGSNAGYVALESITRPTRGAQRRYGSRSARRALCEAATVTACSSGLRAARPRPGKCLSVALTPGPRRPSANAHAERATAPGSDPNERVPRKLPWSTSATGARSVLIPRRRSARPVAAPSGPARDAGTRAGASAGGSDRSRRTSPPSWSTAMSSGGVPPARAARCSAAIVAPGRPLTFGPKRMTPPIWPRRARASSARDGVVPAKPVMILRPTARARLGGAAARDGPPAAPSGPGSRPAAASAADATSSAARATTRTGPGRRDERRMRAERDIGGAPKQAHRSASAPQPLEQPGNRLPGPHGEVEQRRGDDAEEERRRREDKRDEPDLRLRARGVGRGVSAGQRRPPRDGREGRRVERCRRLHPHRGDDAQVVGERHHRADHDDDAEPGVVARDRGVDQIELPD